MVRRNAGFTFVEIMIVIAIIGLLAAIAIPQYLRFTMKTKRTEGILVLRSIFVGEMTYFTSFDRYVVEPASGIAAEGWVLDQIGLGDLNQSVKYYARNCGAYPSCLDIVALDTGYVADARESLDADPVIDWLTVGSGDQATCGGLLAGKVHQVFDDVTNTLCP